MVYDSVRHTNTPPLPVRSTANHQKFALAIDRRHDPRRRIEVARVGGRYGCFCDLETWRAIATGEGFNEFCHHYRQPAVPAPSKPGSPRSGAGVNDENDEKEKVK